MFALIVIRLLLGDVSVRKFLEMVREKVYAGSVFRV